MKIARRIGLGLFALALAGCGSSQPVSENGVKPSTTTPTVAHESPGEARTPTDGDSFVPSPVVNAPAAVLPVDASSTPEKVVSEFLNAMKTGNDGVAAGLLTKKAREETAKHSLAVQPPGSPTAVYEVGEGEVSTEDPTVAQVGCLWTEKDDSGERTEQVVWVLRKDAEGWRVFGMATHMATRTEPVFFDFEEPAEMMNLMEEISQEMAAMDTQAAAQTAASPEGGRGRKTEDDGNSLRR